MLLKEIVFLVFFLITILGALGAVGFKKVFHNALSLGLSFFGMAGIYVLLNAEFIAAVQIIVYIGAISIAIVFAVMLSDPKQTAVPTDWKRGFAAACISLCLLLVLVGAIFSPKTSFPTISHLTSTTDIGRALLSQFVIPFELVSLVLLIAIVGALVIVRKTKEL